MGDSAEHQVMLEPPGIECCPSFHESFPSPPENFSPPPESYPSPHESCPPPPYRLSLSLPGQVRGGGQEEATASCKMDNLVDTRWSLLAGACSCCNQHLCTRTWGGGERQCG